MEEGGVAGAVWALAMAFESDWAWWDQSAGDWHRLMLMARVVRRRSGNARAQRAGAGRCRRGRRLPECSSGESRELCG